MMPLSPKTPDCFLSKPTKTAIPLIAVKEGSLKKTDAVLARQMREERFSGKDGEVLITRGKDGAISAVYAGVGKNISPYALCAAYQTLAGMTLDHTFALSGSLNAEEQTQAAIGWGWAAYQFDRYKKSSCRPVKLAWPDKADKKQAVAMIEAVCFLRDLVNTPANDLGTNELAAAAKSLAARHKAQVTVIKGAKIEKEFPMLYAVGKASADNPPQMIDVRWGKTAHPTLCIIGKGIIYDTGGLDLKPSPHMLLMKKDMGGAAHALALAHLIMSLKLPINLRVLIPTAENSIDAASFRPGDIIQSRKGLSVEIGNTDAEGRLVVADAITYASEDKPDMMIDFCTLTGHARVALGFDIPALFSNNQRIVDDIRDISMQADDPVWPLPLWKKYLSEMKSQCADICNDGRGGKAGAIHGALFIHEFADPSIDWVHLDCYAWEQNGRPGRPQGGADTGLRAVFAWIEKKYSK